MNTKFNFLYLNLVNLLQIFPKKGICIFLFIITIVKQNHAQSISIDTTLAKKALGIGYKLQSQSKNDSAYYYFKKASKLYKIHKIWDKYIESLNNKGIALNKIGKQKKALEALQEAIKYGNQFLKENNFTTAESHYHSGLIYQKNGQYKLGIRHYKKAIKQYNYQHRFNILKIASINNRIGVCYLYSGNHKKAIHYHKTALYSRKKHLGENSKEVAHCYNSIGVVYKELSEYKKAKYYYQKALNIRITLFGKNHKDVAQSYYNIGALYSNMGKLNIALSYVHKALLIFKKEQGKHHTNIGAVNNNLGIIHLKLGNYKKSVQHQQIAINIFINKLGKDHPYLTYAYKSMGTAYKLLGLYDFALTNYTKALDIEIKAFGKDHSGLRITYTEIGDIYNTLGQYYKALTYYKRGLNIHIKHFGLNNPEIVNPYVNMGVVYKKLGKYDTALNYYQKTLDISKKTWGNHHLDVADAYLNISVIYQKKNQYLLAHNYLKKAIKIRINLLGKNHPKLTEVYSVMGDINKESGQYKKASHNYLQALKILQKSIDSNHPNIAKLYNSLGDLYFSQKKYKQSLDYYQKAIIQNTPNIKETKITFNLKKKKHLNGLILLESLRKKAKTIIQLNNNYNDNRYKKSIINTYFQCNTLIDKLRQAAFVEKDKILLGEIATEIYQNAIIFISDLYKREKSPYLNNPLDTLFYFSEKNKAMVLNEALHENSAKYISKIPDSILTLEQSLKTNYTSFYKKVTNKLDTLNTLQYQNHLFQISQDQEELISYLEKNYPKYHKLKHDLTTVKINDIQERLDEKSALLSYVMTKNKLFLFTVTKNTTDIQPFSLPKNFDSTLNQFIKVLTTYPNQKDTSKSYQNYTKTAHQIYTWILQKSLSKLNPKINSLIIIPDQKLNYLSFDALLYDLPEKKATDNSNNYASLPYITHKYKISYAFSATLWHETFNRIINNNASSFFGGFAPNYKRLVTSDSITQKENTSLPGAKEEVLQIAKILNGEAWIGKSANKKAFKQNACRYRILHLAMHALVDDQEPMNSSFIFTTTDTKEDRQLYASELYSTPISADLVVLSACNSGKGLLKKGEGLMSLSRTFMYAGCPSQIMSLWQVSDLSSKQIMITFYKELKKRKTINTALRNAKLKYINQIGHPNYSHPFFWASFIPIGNMESINLGPERKINYWYSSLIFISITVISFLIIKRRS